MQINSQMHKDARSMLERGAFDESVKDEIYQPRFGTCPYTKTIGELAHRVILVYPGEPDELQRHADEFIGSRSIPDPLVIVRDPDMQMVTEWGLRWDAPRETAYPATFVINKNRRVAFAKVSKSHAGRTTPDEILRELRKL